MYKATNAERQKAYRERLKRENPNKYEEIRVKHLSKVKENIRKKKYNKKHEYINKKIIFFHCMHNKPYFTI